MLNFPLVQRARTARGPSATVPGGDVGPLDEVHVGLLAVGLAVVEQQPHLEGHARVVALDLGLEQPLGLRRADLDDIAGVGAEGVREQHGRPGLGDLELRVGRDEAGAGEHGEEPGRSDSGGEAHTDL
jgi:hypothetical protein